eukprot:3232627-Rhodomonas_salina.1
MRQKSKASEELALAKAQVCLYLCRHCCHNGCNNAIHGYHPAIYGCGAAMADAWLRYFAGLINADMCSSCAASCGCDADVHGRS